MKTRIVLLLAVLFIAFSHNTFAANKKGKKENKEEVVFDVSMTCHSCQKRIEKNIPFEKGVTDLKVNLPAKTVMIEYNTEKTTCENLQKAFNDLGYEATIHDANKVKE